MSLSETITSLKTLLENAELEVKALESGKKASSSRARKSLQQIKVLSHQLRKNIIEEQKKIPVKPRIKKEVEDEKKEVEELPPEPPKLVRSKSKKPKN